MSRPSERWIATEEEMLSQVLARLGARAALAEGRVFVAGRRAQDPEQLLPVGTSVEVYALRESQGDLEVLFADAGLVFVAKPPGMATEPERRGAAGTLVSLAAARLGVAPEQVHALSRLDVGVSGVVLLGIEAEARRRVTELRAQGRVTRRYVALSAGAPDPERGTWNDAIGKPSASARRQASAQGDAAQTHYRVISHAPGSPSASVLALEPTTGRTHQLRVHAAAHGAPLFGDRTYGGPGRLVSATGEVSSLTRILLHAAWIELGDLPRVNCPLPEDFSQPWQAMGGDPAALTRAVEERVLA
jgi:23S rRNA-/tRNA-specific pseudouridylate synthase